MRRQGRHDHRYVSGRRQGYKAATETVYFALSGGQVSAYLDNVRARGVGRFSILVNSSGVFRSQTRPSICWHRAPQNATTFGKPGTPFVSLEGDHYAPLERRGSLVVSRVTYRSGPLKAVVIEMIDPISNQFVSARWTYTIGGRKFRFRSTYSALTSTPALPRPSPLC